MSYFRIWGPGSLFIVQKLTIEKPKTINILLRLRTKNYKALCYTSLSNCGIGCIWAYNSDFMVRQKRGGSASGILLQRPNINTSIPSFVPTTYADVLKSTSLDFKMATSPQKPKYVKIMLYLKRQPNCTDEKFHRHWRTHHVELAMANSKFVEKVRRYNQVISLFCV